MQTKFLQDKFGVDVDHHIKLKEHVFLLRLKNQEEIILKKRRIRNKNFMDDHRFDNEVRMYNYVSGKNLKNLHVPRILGNLKNNVSEILLEYIPKLEGKKINITEFVEAYIELQLLDVPRNLKLDLINQYGIGLFYKVVIVSLVTLRKKLSFSTCLKIVLLYLKLNLSAKSLGKTYWLHGDLNSRNFFYHKKNDKLYFIDFEIMFYTKKWLLTEIIAKCFFYDEEKEKLNFDLEYLRVYLENARVAIEELPKINVKQQFRFSILQRSVQIIAHTKLVDKKQAFANLLNICLDDSSFDAWYFNNVEHKLSLTY